MQSRGKVKQRQHRVERRVLCRGRSKVEAEVEFRAVGRSEAASGGHLPASKELSTVSTASTASTVASVAHMATVSTVSTVSPLFSEAL